MTDEYSVYYQKLGTNLCTPCMCDCLPCMSPSRAHPFYINF